LAYSATLPSWAIIDTATGVITGTPLNADVGTYSITVTATDAAGTSASETYTLEVNDINDAMIKINNYSYLDDVGIEYFSNDVSTDVITRVDNGGIKIHNTLTFDEIKLLNPDIYNPGVEIGDAVSVLRYIVGLDTYDDDGISYNAADVDNDDKVEIGDAVAILRDIVKLDEIDTFDLIDENGNRVTQIDADAIGVAPTWTIVANGDVDQSGSFVDPYVYYDI